MLCAKICFTLRWKTFYTIRGAAKHVQINQAATSKHFFFYYIIIIIIIIRVQTAIQYIRKPTCEQRLRGVLLHRGRGGVLLRNNNYTRVIYINTLPGRKREIQHWKKKKTNTKTPMKIISLSMAIIKEKKLLQQKLHVCATTFDL